MPTPVQGIFKETAEDTAVGEAASIMSSKKWEKMPVGIENESSTV